MINNFSRDAETFIRDRTDADCDISSVGCKLLSVPSKGICFHLVEANKVPGLHACDLLDITERFAAQGVRLIQLWEDLWYAKKEQVTSRISVLCGNFKRIHARQTSVITFTQPELDTFMNRNHLQGSTNARFKYALVYNGVPVAAASFAAFRNYQRGNGISRSSELIRFANLNNHVVAGGLSKLLAHFEQERAPGDIMTYADRDWSQGESYKHLGFVETEITEPQKFFIDRNTFVRNYISPPAGEYISGYNTGNIKYLKIIRGNNFEQPDFSELNI